MAQDIQVVTYTNTVWTYNDTSIATDNPNLDPTHAWRYPGFVPTIGTGVNQWKTGGKGLFGNDTSAVYNEPTDPFRGGNLGFATPLDRLINGTAARVTFYFITKFDWPHDPTGVILRGTNYLDDGAIVYLNGVEVFRARMGAAGTEQNWGDFAENQGNEGVPEPLEYSASSLVRGENVLAVELHQSSATSSDVAFATALRAVIPFAPTILTPAEPADRTVTENRKTVLSISADGSPRPTYQWFKDGNVIPGATSNSYTINSMTAADAGLYKVVLNNEFGSAMSREANISYLEDTAAPVVAQVGQAGAFNTVVVTFDEALDQITATDPFTYLLDDGNSPLSVTLNPDGTSVTVVYQNDMLPGTAYTISIAGVGDLAGNNMPSEVSVQFTSWVPTDCGGVLFEAFDTADAAGTAITLLTGHPNFPNKPRETFHMPSFSSRNAYTDDTHEQYGGRMRALFIPPTSGNWVFYLSSDDAGQLFLNPTGPGEGGKILIQEETSCCNPYASHASAPYALEGGKAYYLEALYKEGGGGDYCHVWAGPQGTTPPSAAAASLTANDAIPGSMLGYLAAPINAAGTFTISQQPANVSVVPNTVATFSVGTSSDAFKCYQWLRDGVEIPNANGSSYSFTAAFADNGAKFSVRISIIGSSTVTSSEATLTVAPDTTRPTALSAATDAAGKNVTVTFSEPMGNSAANAGNYTINGVAVTSATQTSPTVVTLVAAATLQDCVRNALVITGVADAAGNPVNPNPTTINFTKPQVLVALGASWRYNDAGTDLGTAWSLPGFNDSSWASGLAPLGFEPAATQVPPVATAISAGSATNTAYFRIHFNLATDPRSITSLQLTEVLDDGAVYYFNGVEARRTRMPDGTVTFATLATAGGPEPTDGTHTVEGPSAMAISGLVYGDNVLAVEVHPSSVTSSDSIFAAELTATIGSCVPPLTVTKSGNNVVLTWPDSTFTLQKAPSVTGPWTSQAGVSGVSLPSSPNNAFFRLVK